MNNSNSVSSGQQQPQIPSQPSGILARDPGMVSTAIEHYRLNQLYQYALAAERLRCPSTSQPTAFFSPIFPGIRPELTPFLYSSFGRMDPRLLRPPDEPKPQHSYIGLIAMAILQSPDKKLVLSDIYQYILDNYAYFRTRGPGWRNSIRHNLSLNDCFVKSGRSANGKGHYWAIHPANIDDFTKGDFRRRKAQRKVRRHMGLAVDDADSPSPPPVSPPPVNWPDNPHHHLLHPHAGHRQFPHHPHFALNPHAFALTASNNAPNFEFPSSIMARRGPTASDFLVNTTLTLNMNLNHLQKERKRQFDVASLLAPENEMLEKSAPLGTTISPASTTKSVKSDEDCDISSRSPSPISPPSKNLKKMSPEHSEEDQMSDEEEKATDRHQTKNSSDEDQQEESHGSRRLFHKISKLSSPTTPGTSSYTQNFNPRISPQFREDSRTNSSSECCGHEITENRINSSLTSPMVPPQNEAVLSHQIIPGMSPGVQGNPFSFNPNYSPHLLQNNPSLASLMLLSSRYREMASGMTNPNKKSH